MQRIAIAAIIALVMVTGGGAAQERTERVLLDAELWTNRPEQALCFVVPPGDLIVAAAVTRGPVVPVPVRISVYTLMSQKSGTPVDGLEMDVTHEPRTATANLSGGGYCWLVEAGGYVHYSGEPHIAVRMTHTPRP